MGADGSPIKTIARLRILYGTAVRRSSNARSSIHSHAEARSCGARRNWESKARRLEHSWPFLHPAAGVKPIHPGDARSAVASTVLNGRRQSLRTATRKHTDHYGQHTTCPGTVCQASALAGKSSLRAARAASFPFASHHCRWMGASRRKAAPTNAPLPFPSHHGHSRRRHSAGLITTHVNSTRPAYLARSRFGPPLPRA